MIPADILEKIRRIHITTTRLATNVFAGEYKSVFKGRGLEFHEVREYQIGDEIRLIDWNVTSRAGKPYVKNYIEERELTIMILLDASRSGYFGSVANLKSELAAELAGVFAASASKNNDRVGLIIFTDRIEKFISPRKGRHHILKIIREALYHKPEGKLTDIPLALRYLDRVTTRSAIVFLISDFYTPNINKPILIANKRHDVIGVRIIDPRDSELPNVGLITLRDAETGRLYCLDTSKKNVRQRYEHSAATRAKELKRTFSSMKVDMIDITTKEPYITPLVEFFRTRKMRRRLRG